MSKREQPLELNAFTIRTRIVDGGSIAVSDASPRTDHGRPLTPIDESRSAVRSTPPGVNAATKESEY